MLQNQKMLLRYKALDECFRMRSKKWTLEMLVAHCGQILGESVSKRSIQSDIRFLRDMECGYSAPIVVVDKKYYTYIDKNFSILNRNIPKKIENQINESIEFLKEAEKFQQIHFFQPKVKKTKTTNLFELSDFEYFGFSIQNGIYTPNEIRNLYALIRRNHFNNGEQILKKLPKVKSYILNSALTKIVHKLNPRAKLVDALFLESQKQTTISQTLNLPFKKRKIPHNLTLWGYPTEERLEKPDKNELYANTFAIHIYLKSVGRNKGAFEVVPGSHQRELGPLEARLIVDNTQSIPCCVKKGGILIQNPLLLKKINSFENMQNKQSILLWFSSYQLPVQYIWNME